MSKHCWTLKDRYESQFSAAFYPMQLSDTKRAEIIHRAEEIRSVRNDISEVFFSDMLGFQDMTKFEAFNFHVINIDGHDFDAIRAAFEEAKATKGQPTCIVAHTVKGKGVSFMENNVSWHGTAPNDEQYAVAMADLEKIGAELEKAGE